MVNVNAQLTASALGRTYSVDMSVAAENAVTFEPGGSQGLPRAKTGVLTVRTSNSVGTLTLEASHGIITGDKIDVYFAGGKRTQVVVGTVAGTSVPITGGVGDNLPLAAAAVTVMKPDNEAMAVVGNSAAAIGVFAQARGTVSFYSGADALLLQVDLEAGASYLWTSVTGVTNPLAGVTVAYALLSHDDGVNARIVRGVIPYN